MPMGTKLQIIRLKSHLSRILTLILRHPRDESLKEAYRYWSGECDTLIAYALDPRMDDDTYKSLTIY
jgi:hypothetical protein